MANPRQKTGLDEGQSRDLRLRETCSRGGRGDRFPQMTQFEHWVLGGGAAFAGLSSGALMLFSAYFPETLIDKVYRGQHVQVELDSSACKSGIVGKLSCDSPYVGWHNRLSNEWTMFGKAEGSEVLDRNIFTNAPNSPGNISIWGVNGTFDNSGTISVRGERVGSLRPKPEGADLDHN
jgi:hypothetical protein